MADLKDNISEATKAAMKARDKARVATLRMVNAEIKRVEVDERRELADADVLSILNKMVKQRLDAHSQYADAGRDDLAAIEEAEIAVIRDFLPEQMSEEDLAALVEATIAELGAQSMADMGKVMGVLKGKAEGRADMGALSQLVKQKLA